MSDAVGLLAMLVPGTVLVGGILGLARRSSPAPASSSEASEAPTQSSDPAPSPARWLPIFFFGVATLMVLSLSVLVERPLNSESALALMGFIGPGLLGLVWLASRGFLK
ncbi:hypothetical protein MK280_13415 [Myxococcota bacterium]|nr:hypothetical protein [Myxococcota bacterium]